MVCLCKTIFINWANAVIVVQILKLAYVKAIPHKDCVRIAQSDFFSGREKDSHPNCQRLSLTAQADFNFCGELEN